MAKTEYVLNIGDDNVVLTKFSDGKVANAWLGSPDPAMATEELGEALAEDKKARVSVIIDTLDQSFKEEEVPKVSILDRRKLLARHINMAFPGANMRGARVVKETEKKTLIYEFASVPLDGRIPGWMDFVASLPNDKGGVHAIATENVDILKALAPKDVDPPEEGKNHWRHMIGINVTGGLRQIIEKNGRLSLTRLTQAPPADTPPEEFADMIVRDFKATITYIRRLGYQVGEPLDLVVLTTPENKAVLQDFDWEGARSVTVYTPYEAGAVLGLGSLGKEEQGFSDVLHAAWFVSKRKSILPLTRAAALGDTKDDLRELAFVAAPYAAGLLMAAALGWTAMTAYEFFEVDGQNEILQTQLNRANAALAQSQGSLATLPYTAVQVRNVIEVDDRLDANKVDFIPDLASIAAALETDAVVTNLAFTNVGAGSALTTSTSARPAAGLPASTGKVIYRLDVDVSLAPIITRAEEAVQVARRIQRNLTARFGKSYNVVMTVEPVGAQQTDNLTGGFGASEVVTTRATEAFKAAYRIERTQS